MKGRLRIEPHGPRKEGKKGMFMDYIYLIMFMNLFILMDILKRNVVHVLR